MEPTQWRYVLAYAQFKLAYHNILRGLYTPAKKLEDLMIRILKQDQQREFGTYREESRHCGINHGYGTGIWDLPSLSGVDFKEIHTGFIKVDGVWRDLQYYLSFRKQYTIPDRARPADSLSRVPFYVPKLSQQSYTLLTQIQAEDAELHTGLKYLPLDRPFTSWGDK